MFIIADYNAQDSPAEMAHIWDDIERTNLEDIQRNQFTIDDLDSEALEEYHILLQKNKRWGITSFKTI